MRIINWTPYIKKKNKNKKIEVCGCFVSQCASFCLAMPLQFSHYYVCPETVDVKAYPGENLLWYINPLISSSAQKTQSKFIIYETVICRPLYVVRRRQNFQKWSVLKQLTQLQPNLILSPHELEQRNIFPMIMVTWPRSPPCLSTAVWWNLKISSSSELNGHALKLGIQHWALGYY